MKIFWQHGFNSLNFSKMKFMYNIRINKFKKNHLYFQILDFWKLVHIGLTSSSLLRVTILSFFDTYLLKIRQVNVIQVFFPLFFFFLRIIYHKSLFSKKCIYITIKTKSIFVSNFLSLSRYVRKLHWYWVWD